MRNLLLSSVFVVTCAASPCMAQTYTSYVTNVVTLGVHQPACVSFQLNATGTGDSGVWWGVPDMSAAAGLVVTSYQFGGPVVPLTATLGAPGLYPECPLVYGAVSVK